MFSIYSLSCYLLSKIMTAYNQIAEANGRRETELPSNTLLVPSTFILVLMTGLTRLDFDQATPGLFASPPGGFRAAAEVLMDLQDGKSEIGLVSAPVDENE